MNEVYKMLHEFNEIEINLYKKMTESDYYELHEDYARMEVIGEEIEQTNQSLLDRSIEHNKIISQSCKEIIKKIINSKVDPNLLIPGKFKDYCNYMKKVNTKINKFIDKIDKKKDNLQDADVLAGLASESQELIDSIIKYHNTTEDSAKAKLGYVSNNTKNLSTSIKEFAQKLTDLSSSIKDNNLYNNGSIPIFLLSLMVALKVPLNQYNIIANMSSPQVSTNESEDTLIDTEDNNKDMEGSHKNMDEIKKNKSAGIDDYFKLELSQCNDLLSKLSKIEDKEISSNYQDYFKAMKETNININTIVARIKNNKEFVSQPNAETNYLADVNNIIEQIIFFTSYELHSTSIKLNSVKDEIESLIDNTKATIESIVELAEIIKKEKLYHEGSTPPALIKLLAILKYPLDEYESILQ